MARGARAVARHPANGFEEGSTMKPVMNLDEVEFDGVEGNGLCISSRGQIGDQIGNPGRAL
jgi:hypothetical protein